MGQSLSKCYESKKCYLSHCWRAWVEDTYFVKLLNHLMTNCLWKLPAQKITLLENGEHIYLHLIDRNNIRFDTTRYFASC